MNSFVLTILTAFFTATITWFGANYFGRNMIRFWDLRLEAHKAIFVTPKVRPSAPDALKRVQSALSRLDEIAIEIDALTVAMPKPILWYLHTRGYDLHGAAEALIALSNSLDENTSKAVCFRVKAKKALKLPIDLLDQESADRYQRIENAKF